MIGADRDPLSFHFESLNQGLALPLPGGNLRCRSTALRSRTDRRCTTEVAIAVHALNCMLELGRPKSVRIA
jgi:hypothetical protein